MSLFQKAISFIHIFVNRFIYFSSFIPYLFLFVHNDRKIVWDLDLIWNEICCIPYVETYCFIVDCKISKFSVFRRIFFLIFALFDKECNECFWEVYFSCWFIENDFIYNFSGWHTSAHTYTYRIYYANGDKKIRKLKRTQLWPHLSRIFFSSFIAKRSCRFRRREKWNINIFFSFFSVLFWLCKQS